jgi:hypothetical protein
MQLCRNFQIFEKHSDNVLINVPTNNVSMIMENGFIEIMIHQISVSPGDLRLTKVYKAGKTYAPGTVVQLGDWDAGTSSLLHSII